MHRQLKISNSIAKSSILNRIITDEIAKQMRLNLNEEVLSKWDNYFNNTLHIDITCNDLLLLMLKTLKFDTLKDGYYIVSIDHNTRVNGTKYTIDQLCRLVNYGSPAIKGDLVITAAFDYVEKNIGKILFRRLGVLI